MKKGEMQNAERQERVLQLVKTEVSDKMAASRLVERLLDQFEEWIDNDVAVACDNSYSEGYDDGHGDGYDEGCSEFD